MSADRPSAPEGLGEAGARLWRAVADDFDLDARELDLLARACRQADDVARLEEVVAAEGVKSRGSTGQAVVSPFLVEARQGRAAVARLLAQLDLPDEAKEEPASMAAARASRAAHGRFDRQARVRNLRGPAA